MAMKMNLESIGRRMLKSRDAEVKLLQQRSSHDLLVASICSMASAAEERPGAYWDSFARYHIHVALYRIILYQIYHIIAYYTLCCRMRVLKLKDLQPLPQLQRLLGRHVQLNLTALP